MYKCVVLAFDGTADGRRALREGALLARCCEAAVHLLCVVPETAGSHAAILASPAAAANQYFTYVDVLDFGEHTLREMGCTATVNLKMGDPSEIIADYANEVGADLIVVGHRRQKFLERWWLGSGKFIVDLASCSVLIGKNDICDDEFEIEVRR